MSNLENPKEKYGALKAPVSFCPSTALIELQAVMACGAHKYGAYNFRKSKIDAVTYINAICRHFLLWEDGDDNDSESKKSHLAHIMACCSILIDATYTGNLVDSRSKTGLVSEILDSCALDHNSFVEAFDAREGATKVGNNLEPTADIDTIREHMECGNCED